MTIMDSRGISRPGMFEEVELISTTKAVPVSGRGNRTRMEAIGPDATSDPPIDPFFAPKHPLPPKQFDTRRGGPADVKRAAIRHGAVKNTDGIWY